MGYGKLRKFSTGRCKVLHQGKSNPRHHCMLQAILVESSFAEKSPAVLMVSELNMKQESALAAQTGNGDLGCSRRSVASRPREVILAPCSALMKPHLED